MVSMSNLFQINKGSLEDGQDVESEFKGGKNVQSRGV